MEINVCIGSACHLKGSYDVIKEFQKWIKHYNLEDKIILKGAFCLNHCTEAVSVKVDEEIHSLQENKVHEFILALAKENGWKI